MQNRKRFLQTSTIKMPPNGVVELVEIKDNIQLRTARWLPERTPNGTILLCQGYSEFIEKYDEVVAQLLKRNYAVLTFDWRGQGLSSRMIDDPQKGHITSFSDFITDADLIHQQVVLPNMPPPYHIMGHSMGGHLAFRMLQEFPDRYEKAVLCAPFFGWSPNFGAGKMPTPLVLALSKIAKLVGYGQSYTIGATPPYLDKTLAGQTSDRVRFQKRVEFYKEEPYILQGGPTWNWILESTKSLQLILNEKRIQQIKTPILLATGAKDEMVDPKAHHAMAARSALITLYDFPESMHEILMEEDAIQKKFWQVFDEFMR